MSFLQLHHLGKKYPDTLGTALEDFSLSLEKGQRLAIIGESGSGKSTLLRIIAGLEAQDKGTVTFIGDLILNPTQKLVAGYEEIQLIHQQFKLHPFSTAEENIKRPLLLYDKAYAKERTEFLLELFRLTDKKDRLPRELSGGEQQKVAIARGLSIEPELLLLDEPFSNLDVRQKRELLEELRDIFDEIDLTVICVTHDLSDALAVADQLCVMRSGKLIQQGNAVELFQNPKNHYVASLFSRLNRIPEEENGYVRPQDVRVDTKGKGIAGKIKTCQFRTLFNLLTVSLDGRNSDWHVLDSERKYKVGESVKLAYNKENVLKLGKD